MSFGFGVGDFLAVLKIANTIRSRFVDAPDQFKAISIEVKSLSNLMQDVDDVLPQRDLSDEQKTKLEMITEGCKNVLKDLEDLLDRCQELDSNIGGFGKRSRRVWKRLRWDQKAIDGLRSRIASNVLLLNTFLGQISNQTILEINEGVNQLVIRQDSQEQQAILDWLTPIDYAAQQSDILSRREPSTGAWLIKSDQFQTWVKSNCHTLFCPGIPGAGKTIGAAIVIDELHSKFQNDSTVSISYVYCNFRRQQEQKPVDLLASLLKQMLQRLSSIPKCMTQLYERHRHQRTHPSTDEICQVLRSVAQEYSQTFIIVDALDECQVFDGARKRFLTELFHVQTDTKANLLATSRFIPEIERDFEGRSVKLEIRASNEDLNIYIDGNIPKLPSFVSRNDLLKVQIKETIIQAVDGMFLLAKLHLDSLAGQPSPKALKKALKTLSKGFEGYDKAYQEAVERIKGQVQASCALSMQVLTWITCAKRQLTTLELQHAIAIELGESKLDEENLPDLQEMVSVCAGLVAVDEESEIIRLVHYTTQEFFERTRKHWFPNSETEIADACITYLLFDPFSKGSCNLKEDFEERLLSNPFYSYAAQNWGIHLRNSENECSDLALAFLTNESLTSASGQAMVVQIEHWTEREGVLGSFSDLDLAAYFGLAEISALLLEDGHMDVNRKSSLGYTPLSFAAVIGQEAVVRLLLTQENIDVSSESISGQTPLCSAAGRGHEAVVRLLLTREDINVNSKDTSGRTPLHSAAEEGQETVVKLLLAQDNIDINSKDSWGATPLSRAALKGEEVVVRLLLEQDNIKINLQDEDGRTPLYHALNGGNKAVEQLLLTRDDIMVNIQDQHGRTPLSNASRWGYRAGVRLLLAREDIEVNLHDEDNRTPLSFAADHKYEEVVPLLLARDDIEVNLQSVNGRTPLSYAAAWGNEAAVQLLLARDDIDINLEDSDCHSPLWWAREERQWRIVQLLESASALDLGH